MSGLPCVLYGPDGIVVASVDSGGVCRIEWDKLSAVANQPFEGSRGEIAATCIARLLLYARTQERRTGQGLARGTATTTGVATIAPAGGVATTATGLDE